TLTQFFSQSLRDGDPALCKPTEQEHAFLSDGVDDVANLLVVEQEIDELRDLDVIDGDLRLVPTCVATCDEQVFVATCDEQVSLRPTCDDQVLLLGPFQF